jgi:hypothetical protein
MGKRYHSWRALVIPGDLGNAFCNKFPLAVIPWSRVKHPAGMEGTFGNGAMIWTDEPNNPPVLSVVMHPYARDPTNVLEHFGPIMDPVPEASREKGICNTMENPIPP